MRINIKDCTFIDSLRLYRISLNDVLSIFRLHVREIFTQHVSFYCQKAYGRLCSSTNAINVEKSGQDFESTVSIVLIVLVKANYKLVAFDVGTYGRKSDGGILDVLI